MRKSEIESRFLFLRKILRLHRIVASRTRYTEGALELGARVFWKRERVSKGNSKEKWGNEWWREEGRYTKKWK